MRMYPPTTAHWGDPSFAHLERRFIGGKEYVRVNLRHSQQTADVLSRIAQQEYPHLSLMSITTHGHCELCARCPAFDLNPHVDGDIRTCARQCQHDGPPWEYSDTHRPIPRIVRVDDVTALALEGVLE